MLKYAFKKYLFRLLIFSICIAGFSFALQRFLPAYASPALPFLILFFFIIILFTHYLLLRGLYKKDKKFVSNYILATTIKFLSYIIFVLVYLVLFKEDRILFTISFLILYLLFSIFEIFTTKREQKES